MSAIDVVMDNTSHIAVAVRKTPKAALMTAIAKLPDPIPILQSFKQVVIKPSIYDPNLVGNTNLDLMRAIIRMLKPIAPISIVESDNPIRSVTRAFQETGYKTLSSEGAELLNLTLMDTRQIQSSADIFLNQQVPVILNDTTFLVNVATLKYEQETSRLGAGIKNLFGLLPQVDKSIYHSRIDSVLVELLQVFRPNLSIIDLTEPVVGKREEGKKVNFGGVIIGVDPVAVDAFCASILNLDPLKIPYIRNAYELGMGEALLERIHVHGTEHQKNEIQRLSDIL
ncbi:MAG: DUF362 domain-containing protein [Candidatus Thorarchaeota archaeon]|jgi:uncharacterized protein (DUF362 family)